MDTATLTLATDDTVLLPAVRVAGRHRSPSLLARVRGYTAGEPVVTVVIVLAIVLMVAGVVASLLWPAPVSPGAVWDPQPVAVAPVVAVQPVPCDSDASCAAYDYARGSQPAPYWSDAAGGVYVCPAGWELIDVSEDGVGSHDGRDGLDSLRCLPAGYADGTRWS